MQVGGWNASATIINSVRGHTWNASDALYPMYDGRLGMFELFPGELCFYTVRHIDIYHSLHFVSLIVLFSPVNCIVSCLHTLFVTHADIHKVTPQKGSVKGGTKITISGTGFGIDTSKVSVDVDGISCTIVSHTKTEIECLTGEPSENSPAVAKADETYPEVENGYRFRGTSTVHT